MAVTILALVSVLLSGASNGRAENLEPVDVYKRCYIRMTRMVPDSADTLLGAVKDGSMKPELACVALFDRARFNSTGVLVNRGDQEAKAIVHTLHNLHRTWFQSRVLPDNPASQIVRDTEEASLYFTRAAFQTSVKFSSVVTHKNGLAGVRDQASYPKEIAGFRAQNVARHPAGYPYTNADKLHIAYRMSEPTGVSFRPIGTGSNVRGDNEITEVGQLVGVKLAPKLIFKSFAPPVADLASMPDVVQILANNMDSFDGNRHFGGGILGSQGFLAANTNLATSRLPEGYLHINRRLAARVFEDLLCHQLPSLTDDDVKAEVNPRSEHTFQQTSSCMRCHSSIDGAAYGYRNIFRFVSAANPDPVRQNAGLDITAYTALEPKSGSRTFAAQPPTGTLHFRELLGTGVRRMSFNSINELGDILAGGQDLYTCAAKRYYQFFTGVNVDLTQPAQKAVDKVHQDRVLALGKSFKTHQTVRTLLRDIFASPTFKSSNYLTERYK